MTGPERTQRVRELLGVRGHLDGCPGEDDPTAVRVEAHDLQRAIIRQVQDPETGELHSSAVGYEAVTVARCLDCGGQREYERPLAELLAARPEVLR